MLQFMGWQRVGHAKLNANYSLSLCLSIYLFYIFLNLEIYPSMLQPWGFNLLRWS